MTVEDLRLKFQSEFGDNAYPDTLKKYRSDGHMDTVSDYALWLEEKFLELQNKKAIQNTEIKKFIDFLIKESNYKFTEFRLVVRDNGTCYSHVMNRDSTTVDFKLPIINKISC
jgi:hypothetical protein